jgi:hypothetical protein
MWHHKVEKIGMEVLDSVVEYQPIQTGSLEFKLQ